MNPLFIVGAVVVSGITATFIYKNQFIFKPLNLKFENEFFAAEVSPDKMFPNLYQGFHITVINKTDKDLEIDWARTLYSFNDLTDEGFIFTGRSIKTQMMMPRTLDIVLPNSATKRDIKPISTLAEMPVPDVKNRSIGGQTHMLHKPLGAGKHGAMLSIKQGGVEHRCKLDFELVVDETPLLNRIWKK